MFPPTSGNLENASIYLRSKVALSKVGHWVSRFRGCNCPGKGRKSISVLNAKRLLAYSLPEGIRPMPCVPQRKGYRRRTRTSHYLNC